MRRVLIPGLVCAATLSLFAQSRLQTLPGYEQYRRVAPLIANGWSSGAVTPRWAPDSASFTYTLRGRTYRFDIATMTATETSQGAGPDAAVPNGPAAGAAGPQIPSAIDDEQAQLEMPTAPMAGCPTTAIARGRQAFCTIAPDGLRKAFVRDRNLWIANTDGSGERRITSDGSRERRIKYGVASWVYGEELAQKTAMWWSPDSRRLAFYRFDESQVRDYYVTIAQSGIQDAVDVEAYPKAGSANPVADILVYDIAEGRAVPLDVRDGRPFDNGVGHYVYNVRWRADGRELLLNRADRRHQTVEFSGCSPATRRCRTIVRERWPTGWIDTEGAPAPRWLSDGRRFIWPSSRAGWANYDLYDLDAGLIAPLTHNAFDAAAIVKVDEAAGVLFYTARDGDNFMKIQLHRVGLDGTGDVRLTDPSFTHAIAACAAASPTCGVSPDGRYVVDVLQRHDVPPATQVIDAATGRVLASVATSDTRGIDAIGARRTQMFSYTAADGVTQLFGQIDTPTGFDPSKSYPVLVPVYGGPTAFTNIPTESFVPPNPLAEYGFLVARVMYRGVPGTGKRGEDALYLKLGQTEIDDIAAGVRALRDRPYVDAARIGIYGTSYGGYTAAMEMVRHPDVFAAGSASSPVTDWRNYDTIYTERYMWLPEENRQGYDAGSVMTYAANLRGPLLLYYGTADNNVHPSNTLQLIRAFQRAGKSIELEVGPDQGHSSVNLQRMMEFFIDHLVVRPAAARTDAPSASPPAR